jgi:three-Cys-motif partner protein
MPAGRAQYLQAPSDQLMARALGPSTLEKLFYVERYCRAFATAMSPKKAEGKWDNLVYLDLLAGPGRCINADTSQEYDGSALQALKMAPPFDHLFFSDSNKLNISVLRKRIPLEDRQRVTIEHGDCNKLVRKFLSRVTAKTLGVALLDPQGFEVDFDTLVRLSERRMDIIYLFPSGIGIVRNLKNSIKMKKSRMDLFWGPDWRDLPAAKLAAGKSLTEAEIDKFDRSWVKSFRDKVRGLGYHYQDEDPPTLRTERETLMYHLLFFSKHEAGLKLWRGIKQIGFDQQRRLPLDI